MALDDLKALIEEGNKTIDAVRREVDEIKSRKPDVVSEEKMNRMVADVAAQIAAEAKARAALESQIRDIEAKSNRPNGAIQSSQAQDEYKSAFIEWMRNPMDRGAEAKLFDIQRKAVDVRTSVGGSGGFALPEQIARDIAKTERLSSNVRDYATVVQVGTSDYKELINRNGSATAWVGESGARSLTATPNLVEAVPTMGTIYAYPQATIESLDDLFFNVESWLSQQVADDIAIGEGTAFVSGNGTTRPTGFLNGTPVATTDALRAYGTLQYFASGAAATLGTAPFDVLKGAFYGMKSGYRTNGVFSMNSLTMGALSLVKDSTGVPLLQRSVAAGDPDTILGRPVAIFEDMPDIAANAFPIAFGDFKRGYLIVDRVGLRMVRDEVTTPGYIKWNVYKRVGGGIKDSDSIKLIKCAVS